ncbi:PAS domain S-box protein [Paraburkholderia sp. Ac-20347]|uniref:PAS domain-containing protein n=1 Tax=Paraburkholderia sp. Ac-20347 TaxID=2703892 RepID=UPI003216DA23
MYGHSPAEAVGRHWSFLATADDDCAQSIARDQDELQATESHETESWHRRHDATLFWADVVTMAVNTGATLLGFVQVVRDVSDRRRAHDAAVESERSFRLLVEGVTDYSIFMLSPGRLITSWNLGASRIKGYSAYEIIGSHFPRFFLYTGRCAGGPAATCARHRRARRTLRIRRMAGQA